MHYNQLRTAAEESSAAAALFTDNQAENDGNIVFNQTEGHRGDKGSIKDHAETDDSLNPVEGSYWQDSDNV